jgi:hypothetical protein
MKEGEGRGTTVNRWCESIALKYASIRSGRCQGIGNTIDDSPAVLGLRGRALDLRSTGSVDRCKKNEPAEKGMCDLSTGEMQSAAAGRAGFLERPNETLL